MSKPGGRSIERNRRQCVAHRLDQGLERLRFSRWQSCFDFRPTLLDGAQDRRIGWQKNHPGSASFARGTRLRVAYIQPRLARLTSLAALSVHELLTPYVPLVQRVIAQTE